AIRIAPKGTARTPYIWGPTGEREMNKPSSYAESDCPQGPLGRDERLCRCRRRNVVTVDLGAGNGVLQGGRGEAAVLRFGVFGEEPFRSGATHARRRVSVGVQLQ